jgi:hypothetical protein
VAACGERRRAARLSVSVGTVAAAASRFGTGSRRDTVRPEAGPRGEAIELVANKSLAIQLGLAPWRRLTKNEILLCGQ